ncbi:hypothetical protein E2562_038253 [Oryza meyeriana var. granulata]|uniref:RING-type domain-containing protein n=1 Tax=Oryza meyeriana var. granulata TaxID=110450 RepID=A0A6G1BQA8_9ORYZ|nr:hypothetical protein E2562_038253 [Oryza meyeriana var. granulata]
MTTTARFLLPHEIYGRLAPGAAAATGRRLFVLEPHEHFQFQMRPGAHHSTAARRQFRILQRQLDYPVHAGYAPAAAGHAPPPRQSRTQRQFSMPTVPEGYTPAGIPRSNDVDARVPWYRNGRFGSVPASGEAIAPLEETTAGEVREKYCSVCLEVIEEGDKLRKMPCFHCFHESCISEWLQVSRLCPLCRFALPTEAEELEKALVSSPATWAPGI